MDRCAQGRAVTGQPWPPYPPRCPVCGSVFPEHYCHAEDACLIWRGARISKGYGWSKGHLVHRLAWEQAHGPIPPGMVVMHLCDNPPCYRLDHLRMGTYAENTADMMAKGRDAHGVMQARLTDQAVLAIRAARRTPGIVDQLAAEYGVSRRTIQRLRWKNSDGWKHLLTIGVTPGKEV